MRVIEDFIVQTDADHWLSLGALSKRSGMSVRTLRAYLTDPHRPLPHYRMKEPHVVACKARKDGKGSRTLTVTGKVLIRWSDFARWMEAYRYTPNLDRLVDEVVSEIRR